ncbi:unnamed protein product [Symbiodinium natans]|uniref:Uncharacterized protein n=1 Tax=Symbiodinium natans TaxID=878477 RepID=A0A812V2W3_9DINO|nr:unnamed protein product [Symbiodinium natans]
MRLANLSAAPAQGENKLVHVTWTTKREVRVCHLPLITPFRKSSWIYTKSLPLSVFGSTLPRFDPPNWPLWWHILQHRFESTKGAVKRETKKVFDAYFEWKPADFSKHGWVARLDGPLVDM